MLIVTDETKEQLQPYSSSTTPDLRMLAEICWNLSQRDAQLCPSSVTTAGVTSTKRFNDGVTSAELSNAMELMRIAESSILSVQPKF